MSKKPHLPRGLQRTVVCLSALAMMAGATLFSAQPAAAADEELIILSFHDSDGAIRDAVAAMDDPDKEKDKGLSNVFTDEAQTTKQFYAGPAYPEPLDSNCAGVDLSQAGWYGEMALISAGDQTFKSMVYRMGAVFDTKKEIKHVLAGTVQHGYFRHVLAEETEEGSTQHLVRATGEGNPPSDTEFTLCVVWAKF